MPTILKEAYPTAKKEHVCEGLRLQDKAGTKSMSVKQMFMTELWMTSSHIKSVRKLP